MAHDTIHSVLKPTRAIGRAGDEHSVASARPRKTVDEFIAWLQARPPWGVTDYALIRAEMPDTPWYRH